LKSSAKNIKLESFEECIRRRSFRGGISELGTGSQSHSTKTDTVYNILRSVQSDMDRQGREIAQQILKITEGQEKLNYVRFCIRSLPQDQEELIQHVYVKGEGQVAYAKEKYFSKATASRRTRTAMGNLLELYNGRFLLMQMATPTLWSLMDMRGIRNGFMRCWTLLK